MNAPNPSAELKNILEILDTAVVCARTGDYGQVASLSNRALAGLDAFLARSKVTSSHMQKIASSLRSTLVMQQQQDWVGWADVVEYELPELLCQCE